MPGRTKVAGRRVGHWPLALLAAVMFGATLAAPASGAEGLAAIGPGYSENRRGVQCVQEALGVPLGGAAAGAFGQATYRAVVAFQEQQNLPTTGGVGPLTGDALVASGRLAPGCVNAVPTSAPSSDGAAPEVGQPLAATLPAAVSPACVEGSRDAAAEIADLDPNGVENAVTAMTEEHDQAVVAVRYLPSARCAWGWISGIPGSRVWIDRRYTDLTAGTETVLAPRDIQNGNSNTYGAAFALPEGTQLRACGQVRQAPTCTLWFDGVDVATDDGGPGPAYVALGDSFSAGEGAGDYLPGTDENADVCHRSENAYPERVGRARDMEPAFVACSGAKTADYWGPQGNMVSQPPQRDLLTEDTELVTLSMGGNDIGFSSVVKDCVLFKLRPVGNGDCQDRVARARQDLTNWSGDNQERSAPPAMTAMLQDIRERAPNARILTLGYPHVFPAVTDGQCTTGVNEVVFLQREMVDVRGLINALNTEISQLTTTSGASAEYVDVSDVLDGNDLCQEDSDKRYINKLILTTGPATYNQSYHPNARGQRELANRVLCHLGPSCVP